MSFSQIRIGLAMKIEEYVPTMTPTFIAKAKSRMTPTPQMFIASVTKKTVALVRIVRDSVSLID